MTIIVDSSSLAWRSFVKLPDLSAGSIKTGVIYGFLNQILALGERFKTNEFLFCFDSDSNKRRGIYPEYKANRKVTDDDEKENLKVLYEQINALPDILKTLGFVNTFKYDGLESDDIIFEICRQYDLLDLVVVSSDKDLYQCLFPNVLMAPPGKDAVLDSKWFETTYGIGYRQWGTVKALAGCVSDNVAGIKGVGEKTAIKYLRNELKWSSVKFKAIESSEGKRIIERNKKLVCLPFEPIENIELEDDKFIKRGFMETCAKYELHSFKKERLGDWRNFFKGTFENETLTKKKRLRVVGRRK